MDNIINELLEKIEKLEKRIIALEGNAENKPEYHSLFETRKLSINLKSMPLVSIGNIFDAIGEPKTIHLF